MGVGTAAGDQRTARKLIPLGLVTLTAGLSTAIVMPFLALFLSDEVDAGPVREPLETAADFVMSTELREKMMAEFRQYLRDQLEEDLPAANDPPDRRPP